MTTAKAVNASPESATSGSARSSSVSGGDACTHRYLLGEPVGRTVSGRCSRCGHEREWSSVTAEVFNRRTADVDYVPGLYYATALAREGMR